MQHPSCGGTARRTLLGRRGVLAAVIGAAFVTVAACAGASSGGAPATSVPTGASGSASATGVTESAAPAFPVTVKGATGELTLNAQPSHVVSLSPTATETLFAIGAGAQVTAADDQSNYPAEAPKTKLSSFQPNAEAVAGYKPDLVVISNDANGLVASLTKLDIPVLTLPAATTLDDAYAQMVTLGRATGHADDAEKLVDTVKSQIADAVAKTPSAKGLKVYHELDNTYYSATSSTFIGSIYALFGLENIADGAKDASGGYPQLSAEFVVKSAPDLIVLADTKCCGQNAAKVAKRPGFAAVPAVKNGHVIAADDDIVSRWGPRIGDFATTIADELAGQ